MITRRQFLGCSSLVLATITGCINNPTPEEIARSKEREDARNLKGESRPTLHNVFSYIKSEVCYEIYNYPGLGDITHFWDAGRTNKSEGDGSLDYVQIIHSREKFEFIGRKDPRFPEYERMFDEQVRPAAEKAGISFSR